MIGRLHATTIDCRDPRALAAFYAEMLGGAVSPEGDGTDWVDLVTANGQRLSFQRVAEHAVPEWPGNDGAQQMHLDLVVDDIERAHEQVLALGAVHLATVSSFRVYRDPAGHPFCIFE